MTFPTYRQPPRQVDWWLLALAVAGIAVAWLIGG